VPFETEAVVALEEALEPMLEALCAAALKHATSKGRVNIEEEDLRAVSKSFMKGK
jgi:histone H3/H4